MNKNGILSNLGLGMAVTCAIVSTSLLLRREFRPRAATAVSEKVENWAAVSTVGHRLGNADAPVVIVEFADFQCPACRHFETRVLGPIRRQYPKDVQVVFRHWPLAYHKAAMPAARAAECSAAQGHFAEMYELLYLQQDSLELKPFVRFAAEAGVPDLRTFRRCQEGDESIAAIRADEALAKQIGGKGTPTIIIDGMRLASIPDSAALDKLVRDAIAR